MKLYLTFISISLFISLGIFSSNASSETGTGTPLKYISSCELDLNGDDEPDIVFLVENIRDREVIALMRTANGYNAFVVSRGKLNMHLSCHFGDSIKETSASDRKGRIYKTPGTYIKLTQPEASSVVYFWNGNGFKEVWTSD